MEEAKAKKMNVELYTRYKTFSWDLLFYYAIIFLFFTETKGINAADVLLAESFYPIFKIIFLIPATILIGSLGKKKSLMVGNSFVAAAIFTYIIGNSFVFIVIGELLSAIGFIIKGVCESNILYDSLEKNEKRGMIFGKIEGNGTSYYYYVDAVSAVIAGVLFSINGYIPIICSLVVLIIVTLLSIGFVEPVRKKSTSNNKLMYMEQIKDIKQGFTFILKSERLKALILCAALVDALIWLLMTYHVSLQEELKLSSVIIGVVAAIGAFISAYASRKQNQFHIKYRNKSLYIISLLVSISTIVTGIFGIKAEGNIFLLLLVILAFLLYSFCVGIFNTIIDRYLRNFANQSIDTKIFSAKTLFRSVFRMITSLFAAFLLTKTTTAYCMIILGVIFTIIYVLVGKYMESRVGLKPEEYSSIEKKYDEMGGNS